MQTTRLRDGRRVVSHITEVVGMDPVRGYRLKDLFIGLPAPPAADGSLAFDLEATGVLPDCLGLLQTQGLDLPRGVHDAARNGSSGARR